LATRRNDNIFEMNNISISLKAENLRKTFIGLVAVENLSIEIARGEIFGLLGPNGVDNSVLFHRYLLF